MKVKLALGSKRQAMLLGALALVLVLAVVRWRPGGAAAPVPVASGGAPAPPAGSTKASADDEPASPASPAARARRPSGSTKEVSADEVPVLDRKDFDPPRGSVGAETGRDLFELRPPTPIPPPTPTPRPPAPGEGAFVGPLPPPPPTPTPKPPEISFKFLGSFGPKDRPIAVIQQGDEVFNARAGDTLFGKFVLRKVGYESIDVGFVGFADSETKRLAIAQ